MEEIGEEAEVTTDEPKVETAPTAEQQMETLKAQLEEARQIAEQAKKSEQGLRGSLTEKDRKIKEQADLNSRLDGFEETQKILAAMLNERVSSEGVDEGTKADYLKQYDEILSKQKTAREQAQLQTKYAEYNQKADAIYQRAEKVFADDEDSLFQVKTFLLNQSPDLAERKVLKAETKKPEEAKLKEVDETEKKRLEMEKSGELISDNGSPSGIGNSDEEFIKQYAAGKSDDHARAMKISNKRK